LPTPSETSKALVKRSKHDGVSYNPIVEADELEKILGLSRYNGRDREREPRRRVVWVLLVTGMGEGTIMPVESITTPGIGHLKLTGLLGEVRPELSHILLSPTFFFFFFLNQFINRGTCPRQRPVVHTNKY
jgi:ATP-dependent Lon protease